MNKEISTWFGVEEQYILQQYREKYAERFRFEAARRPKILKRFDQRII